MCAPADPHIPLGVGGSPREVTLHLQGAGPWVPPCWLCTSWEQQLGVPMVRPCCQTKAEPLCHGATSGRVTPFPHCPATLFSHPLQIFVFHLHFCLAFFFFPRSLLVIPRLLFNLSNGCLPLYLDQFWANAILGSLNIPLNHNLTLTLVLSAVVIPTYLSRVVPVSTPTRKKMNIM